MPPKTVSICLLSLVTLISALTIFAAVMVYYPAAWQNNFSLCQGRIADLPDYHDLIAIARERTSALPCFSSIRWKTLLRTSSLALLVIMATFCLTLFVCDWAYDRHGDKQRSESITNGLSLLVLVGGSLVIVMTLLSGVMATI